MMKVSFNSRDVSMITVNLLIYRIFTQLPMTFILSAKSAAPVVVLLGGAIWVFAFFLIARCLSRTTKGNILDTVQIVFGMAGKIIVALVFVFYLVLSQVFTLSQFSELMSLIAFPTSPKWYIAAFLILGGVFGAMADIRGVARLHGFLMPIVLTVFLLLTASTIFTFDGTDTFVGSSGDAGFSFGDAMSQAVLCGDIFILFLIAPTDESKSETAKKIGRGGVAAIVLNTLFVLAFVLKIPSSIAQNGQFPVYLLMKEVYFGRFFQRLDAMILLACALSAMLQLSLSLSLLKSVMNQSFRLPRKSAVPIISGVLAFLLVLGERMFPKDFFVDMIYVFAFGGMAILIVTAAFAKVRRMTSEKN